MKSPALRTQAVLLLRDQQLITAKSLRNLAMRRAQNTKEFLVDRQGIAPGGCSCWTARSRRPTRRPRWC